MDAMRAITGTSESVLRPSARSRARETIDAKPATGEYS
jgi:hypothetical protein